MHLVVVGEKLRVREPVGDTQGGGEAGRQEGRRRAQAGRQGTRDGWGRTSRQAAMRYCFPTFGLELATPSLRNFLFV